MTEEYNEARKLVKELRKYGKLIDGLDKRLTEIDQKIDSKLEEISKNTKPKKPYKESEYCTRMIKNLPSPGTPEQWKTAEEKEAENDWWVAMNLY